MDKTEMKALEMAKAALMSEKNPDGSYAHTKEEAECVISVLKIGLEERTRLKSRAESAEDKLKAIEHYTREILDGKML